MLVESNIYITCGDTVMWSNALAGIVDSIIWDIFLTCWILSVSLRYVTYLFLQDILDAILICPSLFKLRQWPWWSLNRLQDKFSLLLKTSVCPQLNSSTSSCQTQEVNSLSSLCPILAPFSPNGQRFCSHNPINSLPNDDR